MSNLNNLLILTQIFENDFDYNTSNSLNSNKTEKKSFLLLGQFKGTWLIFSNNKKLRLTLNKITLNINDTIRY